MFRTYNYYINRTNVLSDDVLGGCRMEEKKKEIIEVLKKSSDKKLIDLIYGIIIGHKNT